MSSGTPSREILRIAAEQQSNLMVVGVPGRGAADHMFFGSTTNHVAREVSAIVSCGPLVDDDERLGGFGIASNTDDDTSATETQFVLEGLKVPSRR